MRGNHVAGIPGEVHSRRFPASGLRVFLASVPGDPRFRFRLPSGQVLIPISIPAVITVGILILHLGTEEADLSRCACVDGRWIRRAGADLYELFAGELQRRVSVRAHAEPLFVSAPEL